MSNIKSKRHNNNEIKEQEEKKTSKVTFSFFSIFRPHLIVLGKHTHTRLPTGYTKRIYRLKEFNWFGNDCVAETEDDCSLVESVEC